MKDGYKIVAATAARRRQCMKFLIPHILSCKIIDRYDIWVNTTNKWDISFFLKLSQLYPKIRLVYQPDKIINGVASINAFYRDCCDEDTIYIKLDDDIIWMDESALETLVENRIKYPEYFLVSPIIINNCLCTYPLYIYGKLPLKKYPKAFMQNDMGWCTPKFAEKYHRWFLEKIKNNEVENLKIDNTIIAMNRFSINAIAWFGRDFLSFNGVIKGGDEEFLSVIMPTKLCRPNLFAGDSFMVHYSFSLQKKYLDKTDILKLYDSWYIEKHIPYYKEIVAIIREVESGNIPDINNLEYILVPCNKSIVSRIKDTMAHGIILPWKNDVYILSMKRENAIIE